jgi:hypothetical protein
MERSNIPVPRKLVSATVERRHDRVVDGVEKTRRSRLVLVRKERAYVADAWARALATLRTSRG